MDFEVVASGVRSKRRKDIASGQWRGTVNGEGDLAGIKGEARRRRRGEDGGEKNGVLANRVLGNPEVSLCAIG